MRFLFSVSPSRILRFAAGVTRSPSPSIPKWLFRETHVAIEQRHLKPLNSRLSGFMRNGFVEEAQKMFDEMPQRNTVTWNAMIRGYFQNRLLDRAISLFHHMPDRDIYSYNTVIGGLMNSGDVTSAKEVFDSMSFRDVVTWNSMISGYIRNGMIDDAISVFNTMPVKDTYSWNLVIGGLVNSGDLDSARKLFATMTAKDVVSWTVMISGFVNAGLLVEARQLFDQMPVKDTKAWNKIMEGYVKSHDIRKAELIFQGMPEHDLDSWKTLIIGSVSVKRISDAIQTFFDMPIKCQKLFNMILFGLTDDGFVQPAHAVLHKIPYADLVSWTSLIVGYFGLAEVQAATKIFEELQMRDTAVWNATIFGLGENDHGEEGLKLFIRMRESCDYLDESTITSVLKICSELPSLKLGKQTHSLVVKLGFSSTTSVSNAMVTMYARCGNMQSALSEFHLMPTHDLISWNSIICGFAHHGDGNKALEMFEKMLLTEVKPNHISFVGVLSACCNTGLIDKGKSYFDLMTHKFSIKPTREIYTCIVDMLGKNGLLGEAMAFVDRMRLDGIEIPASVWGALLGSCRMYKNLDVAKVVGNNVLEIEPQNSGIYLILAEMYMQHGRVADAETTMARMKKQGVKKQPGCSWIEVNNQGHVFLAGDRGHPKFDSICSLVRLLHREREMFISSVLYQEVELIVHGEPCKL